MKLSLLDAFITGGILLKIFDEFIGCRLTECPDAPEVKYLDKSGYTFRDLSFIVTDSMEVRASR